MASTTTQLTATVTAHDCNNNVLYVNVTGAAGCSWSSANTSIATVSTGVAGGKVTGNGGGSTYVSASYTACGQWLYEPTNGGCVCQYNDPGYGSSKITVYVPAKLVHYNTSCAPNGVGPLQIISDGSVTDCAGAVRATSFCGVNRNLTYKLVDTSGAPFKPAYTITEAFSNFSTTISGQGPPKATSAPVPAGGIVVDAQFLGFTYPECLGSNDHTSYQQSFTVNVAGTNYNLSTVVSISLGRFSGQYEDNVNITTP